MSHPQAEAHSRSNEAAGGFDTVPCAFCHGKGVDPFAILSELSTCGSCGGRGVVHVRAPHARCTFCRGSGSHKTYRCPVCGGAGAVARIEGPTLTCPDCAGTAYEASSGLPCLRCRGLGVIPDRTRSHPR